MKMEDQICALEYAKRLKELGVRQESYFYWTSCNKCTEQYGDTHYEIIDGKGYGDNWSAFTVAELFEDLPACIDSKMDEPFNYFWLYVKKRTAENIKYIANYVCDSMPGEEVSNPLYQLHLKAKAHDESLANCLAKMKIYLLENNLLQ